MRVEAITLSLLQGTACALSARPAGNTSWPYSDSSLSAHERASDLLARMTWEEKVGQLGGIRRPMSRSDGKVIFNRTSFEQTRETQNGQIGKFRADSDAAVF